MIDTCVSMDLGVFPLEGKGSCKEEPSFFSGIHFKFLKDQHCSVNLKP